MLNIVKADLKHLFLIKKKDSTNIIHQLISNIIPDLNSNTISICIHDLIFSPNSIIIPNKIRGFIQNKNPKKVNPLAIKKHQKRGLGKNLKVW